MKNTIFFASITLFSQVGINIENPTQVLDVKRTSGITALSQVAHMLNFLLLFMIVMLSI
ncbi:hypothetical protein VUJ46_21040 [Chryseobacterium sp. MYb264]|uniref:hypothetical protein n=1 Tax=Chryseobacterium sp. MYb264 TaxID=2745153 RepID=UPI002E14824E|nr:hypothetical protein VUJ46_21040 [Chryseobacterium sp. MYb264]